MVAVVADDVNMSISIGGAISKYTDRRLLLVVEGEMASVRRRISAWGSTPEHCRRPPASCESHATTNFQNHFVFFRQIVVVVVIVVDGGEK